MLADADGIRARSCPRVLTTAAHQALWLGHLRGRVTSRARLVQANQLAIRVILGCFSEEYRQLRSVVWLRADEIFCPGPEWQDSRAHLPQRKKRSEATGRRFHNSLAR